MESPTKHVRILVVTIAGKSDNPINMLFLLGSTSLPTKHEMVERERERDTKQKAVGV